MFGAMVILLVCEEELEVVVFVIGILAVERVGR